MTWLTENKKYMVFLTYVILFLIMLGILIYISIIELNDDALEAFLYTTLGALLPLIRNASKVFWAGNQIGQE